MISHLMRENARLKKTNLRLAADRDKYKLLAEKMGRRDSRARLTGQTGGVRGSLHSVGGGGGLGDRGAGVGASRDGGGGGTGANDVAALIAALGRAQVSGAAIPNIMPALRQLKERLSAAEHRMSALQGERDGLAAKARALEAQLAAASDGRHGGHRHGGTGTGGSSSGVRPLSPPRAGRHGGVSDNDLFHMERELKDANLKFMLLKGQYEQVEGQLRLERQLHEKTTANLDQFSTEIRKLQGDRRDLRAERDRLTSEVARLRDAEQDAAMLKESNAHLQVRCSGCLPLLC